MTNYKPISITPILSKYLNVWCWSVLGGLRNAEVCFQPPSSPIEKVLAYVMPFCVWYTLDRVHWKVSRRQTILLINLKL